MAKPRTHNRLTIALLVQLIIGTCLLCSGEVTAQLDQDATQICPPPVADFSAEPLSGCAPLKVYFTDLSTGAIGWWLWDFGDGTTSTRRNPQHIYDTSGNYTVSLTASNTYGDDTKTKTYYIEVLDIPTADFTASPDSGVAPLTVTFTDQSTGATSWSWDFGDGDTSTSQNPIHIYSATGLYEVSLTASNECGAETAYDTIIVVKPSEPTVDFMAEPLSGCSPLTVYFTDLSTGNITDWLWDFGDGDTSDEQNPQHTFSVSGQYTISLTITVSGSTYSEIKTAYISVLDAPTAGFTMMPDSGGIPLTVNFTDQSIDGASWDWDFGDGSSSIARNPAHTYDTEGRYQVVQTVSNECGTVTAFDTVVVGTPPKPPLADFYAEPLSGCIPLTVTFTDLSTGDITSWLWEFGDGTSSTEQNPQHVYTVSGSYNIKLTVTGPAGSDAETKNQYLTVWEPPVGDFTMSPDSGYAPLTVTFTDQSTYGGDWYWDFGDGNDSPLQNTTHTYTTPGIYEVMHSVHNPCGTDYVYDTVVVKDPMEPPVADFYAEPLTGCYPLEVNFYDMSSGLITSWLWDFGDGTSSTEQNPTHIYTLSGKYTIKLSVSGPGGSDTETKTEYIEIWEAPQAAFAQSPDSGYAPLTVSFTDQSLYGADFYWDFGDGNDSPLQDATHTYTVPGTYEVMHSAHNPCGTDYVYDTVVVKEPVEPPIADFSAEPLSGCTPLTVYFSDLSQGEITGWEWDFGDGQYASEQNPEHIYTTSGYYNVSLTVTGPGGSDTETKLSYITVLDIPTADFSLSPDSGQAPLTVSFTDLSTGFTGNAWWEFGDGNSTTETNPSHIYSTPGQYEVVRIVENECGADSAYDTVIVASLPEPPVADFGAEPLTGCAPLTVYFSDLSTGNITSWAWDFGDGATSNDQNPHHIYVSSGTYDIKLTVSGPGGTDSETKTSFITVKDIPSADFTLSPDSGDVPLTVSFTDQSVAATSWYWDFGDGGSSDLQNPTHNYLLPGRYQVILTATNECGNDFAHDTVVVTGDIEPPVAEFIGKPLWGCAPLTVQFTDLSTGVIDSWVWAFGDGGTSTEQNPQHTYLSSGYYTISLTAIGPGGQDSEVKLSYFTVLNTPVAKFTATPDHGESPLEVQFTDRSDDPLSWLWDFGDGSTSTEQNPAHTYTTTGEYEVTLTVANECGEDSTKDTVAVDIRLGGELSIVLQVDKSIAAPLETLTYTILLINDGDEAVDNVLVIDTIPALAGFVPGSITGDGMHSYHPGYNTVNWTAGMVGPFQTLQLQFRAAVNRNAPDNSLVIDRAWITRAEPAENVIQGMGQVTTTVLVPQVRLDKWASPTVANPGESVEYTVRVINDYDRTLVNTILIDDLPLYHSYITGSARVNGVTAGVTGTDPITINTGNINILDTVNVTYLVEISTSANRKATYTNSATLYENNGAGPSWGPVHATTALETPPLLITKKVNKPSALPGDLLRYTVTVENTSGLIADNVVVDDTMPHGFTYITGTGLFNESTSIEPTGSNPYHWTLGSMAPGEAISLQYTVRLSTQVVPGMNENVAWANCDQFQAVRAIARVNVLPNILTGSIRGKAIVDCDGDGLADLDDVPNGVDIYLDDGSQSRTNEQGMFYFSTVRAGDHVVILDTRDFEDRYYLPAEQKPSVFVYVNEMGESYVLFRLCPSQPILEIKKQVAAVPTVQATKTAILDTTFTTDTTGVIIDYEIDIKSSGGADSTLIGLIDSLPDQTRLIIRDGEVLIPSADQRELRYEVRVGQRKMQRSMFYSLEDLAPGVRRFLINKIYLGVVPSGDTEDLRQAATPAEVPVGPFGLIPAEDMEFDIIGAYFETAKADLRPGALPILTAIADSIRKYEGVRIKAEGHCDYRRIHTREFPSNWELSEARAKSVVDWLIQNAGIDSILTEYQGFAATRPVDTGHTEEAWQKNRRVEVFLKGHKSAQIYLGAITAEGWQGSTVLELDPVNWDTIVAPGGWMEDEDRLNTWEIQMVIKNTGPKAVQQAILTDLLPDGVKYVDESCRIDGLPVSPVVKQSGQLDIELGFIDSNQQIVIDYRLKSLPDQTPAGKGSAEIQIIEPKTKSVFKSNEIVFDQ